MTLAELYLKACEFDNTKSFALRKPLDAKVADLIRAAERVPNVAGYADTHNAMNALMQALRALAEEVKGG